MIMPDNAPSEDAPPTLVVGLGNPLLGDDGVGWRVAEEVQRALQGSERPVEVDCLSVGGLGLMERMAGHDRVILIDAMAGGSRPPGTLYRLLLEDLPDPGAGHLASAHDTTLQTAMQVGRVLEVPLPREVWVVGVEAHVTYEFAEGLSPSVSEAVGPAARLVLELLDRDCHGIPKQFTQGGLPWFHPNCCGATRFSPTWTTPR